MERDKRGPARGVPAQISIHALRMERDAKRGDVISRVFISIHALRMERDRMTW